MTDNRKEIEQELFDMATQEFGISLMQSQMNDIFNICAKLNTTPQDQSALIDRLKRVIQSYETEVNMNEKRITELEAQLAKFILLAQEVRLIAKEAALPDGDEVCVSV